MARNQIVWDTSSLGYSKGWPRTSETPCSTPALPTTIIFSRQRPPGLGEALQPAETALTVDWKNGKVATTDGPYVETKEQLGGIGILEAPDMNHAHQRSCLSIPPSSMAPFSRFAQSAT